MSVTHIAGHAVTINGRTIQRCAWCGEVLSDVDIHRVGVVSSDDSSPVPLNWPVMALIQCDGNHMCVIQCDGQLPEDSCYELVEQQ